MLVFFLSLEGCFLRPCGINFNAGAWLSSLDDQLGKSTQIILVKKFDSPDTTKTRLYAMEKHGDTWQTAFGPFEATLGRNGFAPAGEKREGDGQSPSGIYSLKTAFGYNKSVSTKMPYRQTLEDDIWIDDPDAEDYNRWAKKSATRATSYEKMKRDDHQYKYGIVIEYNTDPVIKGNGSAIFLHVWKGEGIPTAGCVAVSEENMLKILEWLDPAAQPLMIMGII
jgi:L,D-peptidoglycan transpeptidase YkuD (ErfK/YbiS/YcfS/YnhG family)